MKYFVAKSEPGSYSINDLQRETTTAWDGVKNPQALRAIKAMEAGDRVFIYHSGGESAIVGLAEVAAAAAPDPVFRFLLQLDPPTPLSEIKAEPKFAAFALVRQPRLSTMEAPQEFVTWMRKRYKSLEI